MALRSFGEQQGQGCQRELRAESVLQPRVFGEGFFPSPISNLIRHRSVERPAGVPHPNVSRWTALARPIAFVRYSDPSLHEFFAVWPDR